MEAVIHGSCRTTETVVEPPSMRKMRTSAKKTKSRSSLQRHRAHRNNVVFNISQGNSLPFTIQALHACMQNKHALPYIRASRKLPTHASSRTHPNLHHVKMVPVLVDAPSCFETLIRVAHCIFSVHLPQSRRFMSHR